MTSHIDKIRALGERMVGNLNAMGVSASFSDGALTLADKILDVPGLVLDTNISWVSDVSEVSVGQTVNFSGMLFAYHNDAGSNLDFCGTIRNLTLKLYNGQTLVGTAVTDNDGRFSYQFTAATAGTYNFTMVCESGDNFNGCTSSVITIRVGDYDDISLSKTAGYDILSYADEQQTPGSQYCTVTCQLLNGQSSASVADVPVEFGVYRVSDDSLIGVVSTVLTDVNGQAVYTYVSGGNGDVYIKSSCTLVSKTFVVQDCIDTIPGDTDQSSKFGSSIGLRNSGTSNISYDSTNKYYSVNITKTDSESFIPLNSATGLDNIVIEFDGYLISSNYSYLGLCFYKENSNWGRLGTKKNYAGSMFEYGDNTNGSYAESDISGYTPPTTTWLHHKFTITNDTIHRQVYNGETLIYEDTRTYTGFFTSNTKYGFTALWSMHWKGYYKNIKIKPL